MVYLPTLAIKFNHSWIGKYTFSPHGWSFRFFSQKGTSFHLDLSQLVVFSSPLHGICFSGVEKPTAKAGADFKGRKAVTLIVFFRVEFKDSKEFPHIQTSNAWQSLRDPETLQPKIGASNKKCTNSRIR